MTDHHALLHRLDAGRPLVFSSDAAASFAGRGVPFADPGEMGGLVRDQPSAVADHYHLEIGAGVDVLCALTAETMPRALHRLGMAFRAAALTGAAVEYALEAVEMAPRPLLVAGALGSRALPPVSADRMTEELRMHAARLLTAGCQILLARGFERGTYGEAGDLDPLLCRASRRAAIACAAATGLPTWAVLAVVGDTTRDGEPLREAALAAREAGASALIFELDPSLNGEAMHANLSEASAGLPVGVALAASGSAAAPEVWAAVAGRWIEAGARVVGGAAGTTPHHLAALSTLLRQNDRPSIFPRAI